MSALVFDIGGTNLRIARSDGEALTDIVKVETPRTPEGGMEEFKKYMTEHAFKPDSIVGGFPGFVEEGVIESAANLPEWNGFDLGSAFVALSGATVRILNDAELAAVGEARLGAGKGYAAVGYMALGTGVGGALIIHGEPLAHAHGMEPGKQVLDYEKRRTLESLVGGRALEHEFGAPPYTLPRSVFDERTRALAAGIYDAICDWSPDIFILNGSLLNDETAFRFADITKELEVIGEKGLLLPIVRASFGDSSGLMGALALAKVSD